jgi:hypothetical protein
MSHLGGASLQRWSKVLNFDSPYLAQTKSNENAVFFVLDVGPVADDERFPTFNNFWSKNQVQIPTSSPLSGLSNIKIQFLTIFSPTLE